MATIDFIRNNPATQDFYTAQDRATKQAQIAQSIGVDTAVRRGINQMLQQRQPPAYQSPSAAPSSPVVTGPAATDQAAAVAPADPTLPVPPILPTTPPPATAQADDPNGGPTAVQMRQMRVAPSGPDVDAIQQGMSRGATPPPAAPPAAPPVAQPSPKPEASAAPQQLAMANPGTMTDASTGFISPGTLGNPAEEAFLNKTVQHESGGRNVLNQQGPGGTPLSTASGPFQDINGTWREGMQLLGLDPSLYQTAISAPKPVQIAVNDAIYKKYGETPWAASAPGGGGRAQPVSDMGVIQPSQAFMPGYNTSRYDPILQSLAATPGGGTEALKLLQEQGRFDQNNYRRTDVYQRLAMQALAHGDTATARYYAAAGGMQLPESVMSNQGNAVLLGRAGILAHQIYGGDPQQAQQFTQTYLTNGGDVTGAFSAAGVPRSKPNYQLQWARDEEGHLKGITFDRNTGQVGQATDQTGQQATQAPKPSGATANLDYRLKLLTDLGMPYGDAVRQVVGGAPKPGEVANAYSRFYGQQMANSTAPDPEKRAAVENLMTEVYGPNWRSMMPGQTQMQPQGGGGALPMAPAGAGAPSTYQPPGAAPAGPGAAATPPTPQPGTALPPQSAAPGQGGPQGAPTPQDIQQAIAGAKAAIKQGKRREDVIKRLQDFHIPVPPDL